MTSDYSEDRLVQETTATFLHEDLGWRSVWAWDSETYGPTGTLGRATQHEVVLTRDLDAALRKLNPGLPDDAYTQAIDKLTASSATKSLLQTNRELAALVRNRVPVTFKDAKGETHTERLRVIDFDDAYNNDFLVVRELWVRGRVYRRRADVVGFVNGLPLLFVELKAHHKDVKVAYDDNFTDYQDTVPHLFHHNALVMLSNGDEARVGTFSSPYDFFHEWKRLDEDELVARLISKEYAAERRELIDPAKAAVGVAEGLPLPAALEHGDTIYLCTADEQGNMVSLIQSNYRGMGAGPCPPGLGFGFQDRGELFDLTGGRPNTYAPGKRPFHTIIPAFVTLDASPVGGGAEPLPRTATGAAASDPGEAGDQDDPAAGIDPAGAAYMAFGVMGGATQPQAHAQILINMRDFGMNLQEAGDAARILHTGSAQPTGRKESDGGYVSLESPYGDEVRSELERRGHTLRARPGAFGGYQAILRHPDTGMYHGASESRKDGQAAGF